jgi:hypothetical protein
MRRIPSVKALDGSAKFPAWARSALVVREAGSASRGARGVMGGRLLVTASTVVVVAAIDVALGACTRPMVRAVREKQPENDGPYC